VPPVTGREVPSRTREPRRRFAVMRSHPQATPRPPLRLLESRRRFAPEKSRPCAAAARESSAQSERALPTQLLGDGLFKPRKRPPGLCWAFGQRLGKIARDVNQTRSLRQELKLAGASPDRVTPCTNKMSQEAPDVHDEHHGLRICTLRRELANESAKPDHEPRVEQCQDLRTMLAPRESRDASESVQLQMLDHRPSASAEHGMRQPTPRCRRASQRIAVHESADVPAVGSMRFSWPGSGYGSTGR